MHQCGPAQRFVSNWLAPRPDHHHDSMPAVGQHARPLVCRLPEHNSLLQQRNKVHCRSSLLLLLCSMTDGMHNAFWPCQGRAALKASCADKQSLLPGAGLAGLTPSKHITQTSPCFLSSASMKMSDTASPKRTMLSVATSTVFGSAGRSSCDGMLTGMEANSGNQTFRRESGTKQTEFALKCCSWSCSRF